MSSHYPRSGSASASATPVPTPSPQPPPASDESSSEPSTSSRSRGVNSSSSRSQQAHSRRGRQPGRPVTSPLAQEQPGLEVYDPPAAAPASDVRVGRSRVARPGTAPSFWSKEVADNPSQFTFYRDPTPTPPEYRAREKEEGYIGAGAVPRRPGRSSTIALETALTIPPPDPNRRAARQGTVCGLTRRLFWIIVVIAVLLIVGIAVGAGVGVGASKKAIKDPAPAAANSSTPTTTSPHTTSLLPSSTSQPASSTSTSDSASPIPTAATDCPFINNTIYQLPGSTAKFLRLCGIDYSGGDDEAVELANKPTFSFADCMGNCAGTYGCTGCAWGIVSPDEGANHQCWMKGDLKTGHKAAPDWCFAILQT